MSTKYVRRAVGSVVKFALVLIVFLLGWVGVEIWVGSSATPPASVQTFDDFVAWRPTNDGYTVVPVAGAEFVEVQGPGAGLIPSGPAC
jgi:purine-cytosine permease-like protein